DQRRTRQQQQQEGGMSRVSKIHGRIWAAKADERQRRDRRSSYGCFPRFGRRRAIDASGIAAAVTSRALPAGIRRPPPDPLPRMAGFLFVQPKSDLQHDLIVRNLPADDMTARFDDLKPVQMMDGFRRFRDGVLDGLVTAFGG